MHPHIQSVHTGNGGVWIDGEYGGGHCPDTRRFNTRSAHVRRVLKLNTNGCY